MAAPSGREAARFEKTARVRRKAWASRDLRRVIRAFCVECMGGYTEEINRCTAPLCPLYHWRMADSIRQGFDHAADALEAEGFADLARESRRKKEAGRSAWTDRKGRFFEAQNVKPDVGPAVSDRDDPEGI